MQSTCNATGYMPTCSWEDENTVSSPLKEVLATEKQIVVGEAPVATKASVAGNDFVSKEALSVDVLGADTLGADTVASTNLE